MSSINNQARVPNKLINEKSPYLLQHAYNPVNWFPWSQEALDKAKVEDKPIFLSIGYSTCHWCHVMENESFEDDEVAKQLNSDFVCIKVDREERPDIDSVYMSVCQALNGSGGWPLTIIMTPEQKPFFAGTYFPKRSNYGRSGLLDILDVVTDKWKTQKNQLINSSTEIVDFVKANAERLTNSDTPSKELLKDTYDIFLKHFDPINGGFSKSPKFPTPHNFLFLLRYYLSENQPKSLDMVGKSLEQMYRGGIFDHIGGGFSRYSTDEKWLVPHFEKMLYDNAGLSYVYLEAYQLTNNEVFSYVARRILEYVSNELTDELGGFYCGQDADSEGVEGLYYTFSPEEIRLVLDEEDANFYCSYYDIRKEGNFEGKSIPNLLNQDRWDVRNEKILDMHKKIYLYRKNRMKLHKDDKVLTSWNGFMIASFCKAYRVLGDESFIKTAKKAQKFINDNLINESGELYIRWRDGEAAHFGQLDDYAYYAWSLIELYQSTLEVYYLNQAINITQLMLKQFFDYEGGGFYLYAKDAEVLITRPKEIYDGAMPSGNSVAAFVLNKLFKLTADLEWKEIRDKQVDFLASNIKDHPLGNSFALLSFIDILYSSKELVYISKEIGNQKIANLVHSIEGHNIDIIAKTELNKNELEINVKYVKDFSIPEDGEQFYLCENGTCNRPVSRLEDLMILLT